MTEKDEFNELIKSERKRQIKKWGEGKRAPWIWVNIIAKQMGSAAYQALTISEGKGDIQEAIKQLEIRVVNIAAVCKAFWEDIQSLKEDKYQSERDEKRRKTLG